MYISVIALLATITTIYERPIYIRGTSLTQGLGTVLGPIIRGVFIDSLVGQRQAFYINLYISALYILIYLYILPNKDPRPRVSLIDYTREIDYARAILTLSTFISRTITILFSGITYLQSSRKIISFFVYSSILFTMLGI